MYDFSKSNSSFLNNNNYNSFNKKRDLFYLYNSKKEKSQKKINNYINNNNTYDSFFRRIHKINLKKYAQKDHKNSFEYLPKRKQIIKNNNMNQNLSQSGFSCQSSINKPKSKHSTMYNNFNNNKQNAFPNIKYKNDKNSKNSLLNNSSKGMYNSQSFCFFSKSYGKSFPINNNINQYKNQESRTDRINRINISNLSKNNFIGKSNNVTSKSTSIQKMVSSNKKKDSASYACEIDQNYQNKKYVVPQEKKNILLNSLAVQSFMVILIKM